ncbi:ABC transporter ATP-binding protein [Streptomyces sp. NPDC051018]|uniref:ABC transporter ATP-binding protein n=1 Tax=Streptomyces sp. NPDC051018 TaxID=3365639 RepID=UPI00378F8319
MTPSQASSSRTAPDPVPALAPGAGAPALQMLGISKRFGPVCACGEVDLQVSAGEIHGLLGENGAGKSTLMKILLGLVTPDAGRILLRGRAEEIADPLMAAARGIAMVHQHFSLVGRLTVWENIALGDRGRVDRDRIRSLVREVGGRYGLAVDPDARVEDLSTGERQRVEIVKCLRRDPDVLVLDEPTSVLTLEESRDLFTVLRRVVADHGKAVILISHKLDEIIHATDRVTIMRQGRVVGRRITAETDERSLAREMVGRELSKWTAATAVGALDALIEPGRTEPEGGSPLEVIEERYEPGAPAPDASGPPAATAPGAAGLPGVTGSSTPPVRPSAPGAPPVPTAPGGAAGPAPTVPVAAEPSGTPGTSGADDGPATAGPDLVTAGGTTPTGGQPSTTARQPGATNGTTTTAAARTAVPADRDDAPAPAAPPGGTSGGAGTSTPGRAYAGNGAPAPGAVSVGGSAAATRPLLRIRDAHAMSPERIPLLRGLSLELREGEILGIAGVEGNGQAAVGDLFSSLLPLTSGTVEVDGATVAAGRPGAMGAAGIGVIPEDRHASGCVLDMSVAENLVMADIGAVSRRGFLSRGRLAERARGLIEEFEIATPSPDTPMRLLSGGNQQKVVLARELSGRPRVLVAAQPTRGLDIGAIEYMTERLHAAAGSGIAVLLLSTELNEILTLSHRIAVIHRGTIVGGMDRADVDVERLGLMMGGQTA